MKAAFNKLRFSYKESYFDDINLDLLYLLYLSKARYESYVNSKQKMRGLLYSMSCLADVRKQKVRMGKGEEGEPTQKSPLVG